MHEATVHLTFWFSDRNNNKGRTSAYLPFVSSDDQVRGFVAFYIPFLMALSNATISGWDATWAAKDLTAPAAPDESDVYQNLILCYSKDEIYDWIWIASPKLELLELSGDYAGIRLDALRPDVLAILEGWQDVVDVIVNSRGDTFPTEFAVGGLAL